MTKERGSWSISSWWRRPTDPKKSETPSENPQSDERIFVSKDVPAPRVMKRRNTLQMQAAINRATAEGLLRPLTPCSETTKGSSSHPIIATDSADAHTSYSIPGAWPEDTETDSFVAEESHFSVAGRQDASTLDNISIGSGRRSRANSDASSTFSLPDAGPGVEVTYAMKGWRREMRKAMEGVCETDPTPTCPGRTQVDGYADDTRCQGLAEPAIMKKAKRQMKQEMERGTERKQVSNYQDGYLIHLWTPKAFHNSSKGVAVSHPPIDATTNQDDADVLSECSFRTSVFASNVSDDGDPLVRPAHLTAEANTVYEYEVRIPPEYLRRAIISWQDDVRLGITPLSDAMHSVYGEAIGVESSIKDATSAQEDGILHREGQDDALLSDLKVPPMPGAFDYEVYTAGPQDDPEHWKREDQNDKDHDDEDHDDEDHQDEDSDGLKDDHRSVSAPSMHFGHTRQRRISTTASEDRISISALDLPLPPSQLHDKVHAYGIQSPMALPPRPDELNDELYAAGPQGHPKLRKKLQKQREREQKAKGKEPADDDDEARPSWSWLPGWVENSTAPIARKSITPPRFLVPGEGETGEECDAWDTDSNAGFNFADFDSDGEPVTGSQASGKACRDPKSRSEEVEEGLADCEVVEHGEDGVPLLRPEAPTTDAEEATAIQAEAADAASGEG